MKCPICESGNGRRIFTLCKNMKIMGDVFPDSSAYVAKCDNCGLIYIDTDASQQDFTFYYKNVAIAPKYFDMFGRNDTLEYYDHILKLISGYIIKESTMLDIAGAWGEFGAYLKDRGYNDVTVLDPNEICIESCVNKGLKTVCADSTDMAGIGDNSIDLVILNHALEHILDVKTTMREIDRVLSAKGYIFIELPDVEEYITEDASPYNFLTYEHVLHMSLNDLSNLAGIYGYDICESGKYYKKVSNYPSIYAILRRGDHRDIQLSDEAENRIKEYIQKSAESLEQFISPLRETGEPLVLWGIGASTTILLDAFEGCNVVSLIDRNPNRQGLGFAIGDKRLSIQSPGDIGDSTIVILSIPYHESIRRQIRDMGLTNKIVSLK